MKKYKTPTRGNIIREATSLIFQNGFAGTSVDLIIEKAAITKGAFFYHFKSKADLALALLENFAAYDYERLQRAMQDTEKFSNNPKERLLEFIQFFIELFENLEKPPGCLYASVSNEQNLYSDEVKQVVFDGFIVWKKVFRDIISNVLEEFDTTTTVDIETLTSHFNVVLEGAFIVSKALNDPKLPVKHLKILKSYLDLLFEKKKVVVG